MAMLLGAILLHPNFIALKADADVVHVLGLPVKMVTYSSSVIPIFLITLVLPYVERFVNKVVPSVVKFILRPVLTILIMAPISLCVLGPLGSIIGDGLVNVLLAIEKVCPTAHRHRCLYAVPGHDRYALQPAARLCQLSVYAGL